MFGIGTHNNGRWDWRSEKRGETYENMVWQHNGMEWVQARRHWGAGGNAPPIICQTCFWRCYKRSLIWQQFILAIHAHPFQFSCLRAWVDVACMNWLRRPEIVMTGDAVFLDCVHLWPKLGYGTDDDDIVWMLCDWITDIFIYYFVEIVY